MAKIAWIDEPPEFEIEGDGVKVTYRSGDKLVSVRMSRHVFRRAMEKGRRIIDAADREQETRVEELRRSAPG